MERRVKKKNVLPFLVLPVLLLLYFLWPAQEPENPSAYSPGTSTSLVRRGDLTVSVNTTGVIEPITTVELKSKASGEIIELTVEEGDLVTRGKIIARLDDSIARNAYRQAQADLEVAKIALSQALKQAKRQEELFTQGLLSELDYETALLAKEEANSNLAAAEVRMEDAKEQLSDTVIESPMDGMILMKYVEKGQIIASGISEVSGGTTLVSVADMSRVYVKASVDEVDIGLIAPGQSAVVIAETYPDREFRGQVLRIHPQAVLEQNVTTFDVTIEVDNSEGLLLSGMNASIEIIAGYKGDILIVPREALTDARTIARLMGSEPGSPEGSAGGGGSRSGMNAQAREAEEESSGKPVRMVLAIQNGTLSPRQVEIGLSSFEEAEVVSGLAEGDTVLTTVTSKALEEREEFVDRMKIRNQLPGMEKKETK
jgi:HlyD family secretion protein